MDPQAGLVRKAVPENRRWVECLPDDWAQRIAQFALAAEQVFGRPQDIEWAIADGQLWILQSRPIASLDAQHAGKSDRFPVEWNHPADARRFWTRKDSERQRCKPLLPLDIDYVRMLESTRVETCLFLGADYNLDMLVFNGQIYTSPAPMHLSSADLRVRRQAFNDLTERLVQEGRTAWDHWGAEIERANERLAEVDTSRMDGPGLATFLEEAMAARKRHHMLHPMIWFKPRPSYFEAFQAVSKLSGAEVEPAAYRLLEGEQSPLTQVIDGLYNLAHAARSLPAVADWMRRLTKQGDLHSGSELAGFPRVEPGAADWLAQFEAFLADFGDRNGDAYGSGSHISTPTWRDQPSQVVQLAAQFLDANVEAPSQQRERSRRLIEAELQAICAQCSDAQAVETFVRQLAYYRRVQAVVEIHNHHIEQVGLGRLREAVLAAARWLQPTGILAETGDVFWLTFAEILSVLRKPGPESMAETIKQRQEAYQQCAQYQPPPHLGLPPAALPPASEPPASEPRSPANADERAADQLQQAGQVRGLGASAGVASGRARVVETWQPAPPLAPGEILVAENAGPLWLPFFPILAGIVLESGSLGQHAASTAREYGIPAVIAAANARQLIKDGDWISIDGAKGIVRQISVL